VHALNDVRAVQDERLVALARQAAVVLGGEVELLQGRAHAAVVDDDALADRAKEVPIGQGHADASNLDTVV
jgi:hypothetical protein